MARANRSGAAALTSLALLMLCLQARAQTATPIVLEWHALDACPSKEDVLKRIRKLSVTWPPGGPPLRAAATIARGGDGKLHLKLVVQAGTSAGERDILGKTCESLANAAAIHLALLLQDRAKDAQPDRDVAEPGTSNANMDASTNTPTATSTPERIAAERREQPADEGVQSTRNWRVLVQLPLASLQLGPLSVPSFGLALAAGVLLERWRFLVEGHFWLEQTSTLAAQPSVSADVDRISVSLRTCRAAAWDQFELAPCVKLSVEHLSARGAGRHVTAHSDQATWLAAGLGVQWRLYAFDWLSVVATLDAQLETSRPELSIEGAGSFGRLGLAALTITLGAEWIF